MQWKSSNWWLYFYICFWGLVLRAHRCCCHWGRVQLFWCDNQLSLVQWCAFPLSFGNVVMFWSLRREMAALDGGSIHLWIRITVSVPVMSSTMGSCGGEMAKLSNLVSFFFSGSGRFLSNRFFTHCSGQSSVVVSSCSYVYGLGIDSEL